MRQLTTRGVTLLRPQPAEAPTESPSFRATLPDLKINVLALLAIGSFAALVYTMMLVLQPQLPQVSGAMLTLLLLPAIGALISACLLLAQGSVLHDEGLSWAGAGVSVAAVGLLASASCLSSPTGGVLRTSPSSCEALLPAWHGVLALAVLSGCLSAPHPRARRALTAGGVALVALLALDLLPLPDLLGSEGQFTPLLVSVLAGLAAFTWVVTALWTVRSGRTPSWPRAWVSVSLALGTYGLAIDAFAQVQFSAAWWASLSLGIAEFVSLAAGLIAGVVILLRKLERYTAEELARADSDVRDASELTTRLLTATAMLSRAPSIHDVAEVVLSESAALLRASFGAVLSIERDRHLRLLQQVGYDETFQQRLSHLSMRTENPITEAVRTGEVVYVESVAAFARRYPETAATRPDNGARAWIAVPMVSSGKVLGVVHLALDQTRAVTPEERELLLALARQGAQALERASLYEQQREMTNVLQRGILPDVLPKPRGLTLEARYLSGTEGVEVGGDWYDAIELRDGRLVIVLGDVMGKGVGAASIMGQVRNAIRAYLSLDPTPQKVLEAIDNLAMGFELEELVTLAYVLIDPRRAMLTLANAGHLPPLLVSDTGRAKLLEEGGSLPVGLTGLPREQVTLPFPAGSMLMLYSDGLVETREGGVIPGLETLQSEAERLVAAHTVELPQPATDSVTFHRVRRTLDLGNFCDRLITRLVPGPQRADDVSVLVVRSEPPVHEQQVSSTLAGEPALWNRSVLELPPCPESASRARRFVQEELGDLEELQDSVSLCVTELVTDAITHASKLSDTLEVVLARSSSGVRVEVRDRSPFHLPDTGADSEMEGGGGLRLVEEIADASGVQELELGKRVWCEFTLPGTA